MIFSVIHKNTFFMEKQHLKISDNDSQELKSLLSKSSLTVKIHSRIKVLLALNDGKTYHSIHQEFGMTYPAIVDLKNKYLSRNPLEPVMSFLVDKPRSGRPPEITGEERAKITALACSKAPEGQLRWTLRLLADKIVELGIREELSHTQVGKILKKTS